MSANTGVPLSILVKPPYPMLAKTAKADDVTGAVGRGYLIEPKLDGIRCLAVVGEGGDIVQLYNRQLVNITARFPEVVERLRLQAGAGTAMLGTLVLDGEIYVRGSSGHPDFQLVQHRANRIHDIEYASATYPARYSVFDVLSSGHADYMRLALSDRRAVLREIAGQMMTASYTQSEADLLLEMKQGEGLMLKHLSGRYHPGMRSPGWLKVKHETEIECFVGGVTFGIGKREPHFGSLLVGTWRPLDEHGVSGLTYVGTVGTGFTDETLEMLTAQLHMLRTTVNPFRTRGTDWDLAYFVNPLTKVKVRFSNWTKDGVMRFPRFVGMAE